jgi:mxaL protein
MNLVHRARGILTANRSLALAAFACAMLALTFLHPAAPVSHHVYRVVFVLDITQSMGTLDYRVDGHPTSRIAFAKQALRRTLDNLPCGSEAGLAIFTANRSLLLLTPVDVCADYNELLDTLGRVSNRMAWEDYSAVARGLYSGINVMRTLTPQPALVFITDGQESPPVNPAFAPQFDGTPGKVRGMIIGAGGFTLSPIPKFDPQGRPLGYWQPQDVQQTDSYSLSRAAGEPLVTPGGQPIAIRRPTGTEQLSSLKQDYLKQLATATGLSYHRLTDADSITRALDAAGIAVARPVQTDLRWLLALPALLALLLLYIGRRQPAPGRRWTAGFMRAGPLRRLRGHLSRPAH